MSEEPEVNNEDNEKRKGETSMSDFYKGFKGLTATELPRPSEQIQALTAAVNALSDEIRKHDQWAKDSNDSVEVRIKARLKAEHEWRLNQIDTMVSAMKIFQNMDKKLDALQAQALLADFVRNQPKAKQQKRRRRP